MASDTSTEAIPRAANYMFIEALPLSFGFMPMCELTFDFCVLMVVTNIGKAKSHSKKIETPDRRLGTEQYLPPTSGLDPSY